MTYIYNTTNLKEDIIRQIVSVIKPNGIPDVVSITLRNKAEGMMHGNWGKYYPHDHIITLVVPQFLSEYETTRPYSKRLYTINDRYEFVAAICGHEYRHAWQHTTKWEFEDSKVERELDAERYEPEALSKWRTYVYDNRIIIPEDQAISQKVSEKISYRKFRK